MAELKSQHFVPRFYLKRFSDDEKSISLFNVKAQKIIPCASIRSQCARDNFYGADKTLEKILGDLEGETSEILRVITGTRSVPPNLHRDRIVLSWYVLSQVGRTPRAAQRINDMTDQAAKITFGPSSGFSKEELDLVRIGYPDASQRAVRHSLRAYPTLIDLELVLVRAPEEMRFVCSDNPVALFNQLLNLERMRNNTGYAVRGLQIYLPVDPYNLLLFFDPSCYALPSTKTETILATKRDVEHINTLQVASAQDNLYFHPNDVGCIQTLFDHAKKFRRPLDGKVAVVNEEETASGRSQLVMFTSSDIRSDLELSFLRITKRGKAFQLGILTKSHTIADRMRSAQLLGDTKDFDEAVSAGKYRFDDLLGFLRDRYRKEAGAAAEESAKTDKAG